MKVQGENVTIELEGAQVIIPAAAIAELWIEKIKGRPGTLLISDEIRTDIGTLGRAGIYAGIARGPEGGEDYVLEVLEQEPGGKLNWEGAKKWAESVGGSLPTRREAALLFANVPELFEAATYWTGEQYAGDGSFAWFQGFDYGDQYHDRKDVELRARAVRRLPIE